jgi:hypothetical protein
MSSSVSSPTRPPTSGSSSLAWRRTRLRWASCRAACPPGAKSSRTRPSREATVAPSACASSGALQTFRSVIVAVRCERPTDSSSFDHTVAGWVTAADACGLCLAVCTVPRFQQIYRLSARVAWGSDSDVRLLGLGVGRRSILFTHGETRARIAWVRTRTSTRTRSEYAWPDLLLRDSKGFWLLSFFESQISTELPCMVWDLELQNHASSFRCIDGSLCSQFLA